MQDAAKSAMASLMLKTALEDTEILWKGYDEHTRKNFIFVRDAPSETFSISQCKSILEGHKITALNKNFQLSVIEESVAICALSLTETLS